MQGQGAGLDENRTRFVEINSTRKEDCLLRTPRILFALVLVGLLSLLVTCGGESPVSQPPPTSPQIDSISSTVANPDDNLKIYGRDFGTTLGSNKVVFNNILSSTSPFFASESLLEVTVSKNASSGPLWVEKDGVKSNTIVLEVIRNIGDVWTVGGSTTSYSFKVKSSSGGEAYLIIPYSASQGASEYSYKLSPGNAVEFPSPERASRISGFYENLPHCIDGELRKWAQDVIEHTLGGGRYVSRRVPARPEQQDTMNFYVLNTTSPQVPPVPSDFTTVEAVLKYTGTKCYIYSDLNSPSGGLGPADYVYFGNLFDNQIFPTDSTYFGSPTDIDENGHVVILFTPVVNDLTPDGTARQYGFYAGFFVPTDLVQGVLPQGTTNEMEIFYSMVPDPDSLFGNPFSLDQVKNTVPQTLAHEFEHMISFGYRLLNYGANYWQATWLEEGMAHMAEDLNGMNDGNVGRINKYLPDPGAVPLMGDDTLAQRGAIYLFLRYMADQRPGEPIFREMVQSRTIGTQTVEYVTEESFFTTFADWLATLYLSGRGITSSPRYQYTSLNLLDFPTFHPLLVTTRQIAQGVINDYVYASAADFFVIQQPTPPGVEFTIEATSSANLRAVVVRIQ